MNGLLQVTQQFIKKNASTILTCIGGAGVVATSVMAVKATPKAMKLIEAKTEEKGEKLTVLETIETAGMTYVPAVITGTATIACIFGANALNKRQQAALMSAYALLDNSYKEYKKKVDELYGEGSDQEIRDELAKDKYEETKVEDGKRLFYDEFSERYFEATTEDVLRAEYELNRLLSQDSGMFLNEFYELVGLDRVDYGDHLGWSAYELCENNYYCWIEFNHRKVIMDDGLECTIISFMQDPVFDFENY